MGKWNPKTIVAYVFVISLFLVSASISLEFWGSKHSNKYHYPTCRWAKKIKPYNLVIFESPEEAIEAGYIPCKVCKPPLPSNSDIKSNQQISFKFSQST